MSARQLTWLLAAGVTVAYGALVLAAPASTPAVIADNLGTTTAAALAALAAWVARGRAQDRRVRRGWLLVSLATACWSAGNALWAHAELVTGDDLPFPSLADVGYLAFLPLAFAGVHLLAPPRDHTPRSSRLDLAANAVAFGGLGILLATSAESAGSPLATMLAIAYPLGDLLVLATVLTVLTVVRRRPPWLSLVLAAVSLLVVADLAFANVVTTSTYQSGTWISWGWFAGFVGLALAARADHRPLVAVAPRHDRVSELVRHLPAVAAGALLVTPVLQGHPLGTDSLLVVLAIGAVNAVRHAVTARENRALTATLRDRLDALEAERARSRQVIDQARDPYVELDRDGRIRVWNDPAEAVLGWSRDQALGRSMIDLMVPEDNQAAARARLARFVATDDPTVWDTDQDIRYRRPDGSMLHAEIAAWSTGSGDRYRIHGFIWDITERVEAQALLEEREARWRALVRHTSDITLLVDAGGHLAEVVPTVRSVLGWQDEHDGAHFSELVHPDDLGDIARLWGRLLDEPGGQRRERFRLRRFDGSWAHVEATATNLVHEPAVGGVVVNLRDLTAELEAENELARRARRDALTGLPNRVVVVEALERALTATTDGTAPGAAALLLMDLDGFKDVNDGLGHDHGDQLLIELGHRIDRVTRAHDVVGRLGGDEFAVLLTGLAGLAQAERVADGLARLVAEPVPLDDLTVQIGVSIGISPLHPGDTVAHVLQRADVAMYRAKRHGLAHATYGSDDDDERRNALRTAAELRDAIAQGDLVVHYQPQCDLATGQVVGTEALVRWEHPDHGLVPPDEFIPLAERTGVIAELTQAVLHAATDQCARWRSEGLALSVSVNLSPRVLTHPDLVAWVDESLRRSGLRPEHLTLEVTETAFPELTRPVATTLAELHGRGVRLSVDDFGTGHSSLSKLKELAVHELKVDRCFVARLGDDDVDRAIVRSVIDLGHALGLSVVAEGIETPETAADLRALGCRIGQGFLWSRPMPGVRLTGWVLEHGESTPDEHHDDATRR